MNYSFWEKNKVFILGLLSAIAIVLKDYTGTSEVNWATIGLAVGLAALSYLAKEWRGQGLTITGIIGVAAEVVISLHTAGSLSWQHAILSFVVAVIAAASPDPKSRGYEHTATIKNAKAQGESILPAKLTAKPGQEVKRDY